jgi:hypothetical protein
VSQTRGCYCERAAVFCCGRPFAGERVQRCRSPIGAVHSAGLMVVMLLVGLIALMPEPAERPLRGMAAFRHHKYRCAT